MNDTTEKPLAHRRLERFDMVDEVRFRTVPRYKTSGSSGDEWRHGVDIEFLFKGLVIHEAGYRDMQTALLAVGHERLAISDRGMTQEMLLLDQQSCDQPSCRNEWVARFVLKRLTARDGSWLDASEGERYRWYRKFCMVHVRRGDASREDCDDNYEAIDGIGPDASTNVQSSPSAVVIIDATGSGGSSPPASPASA